MKSPQENKERFLSIVRDNVQRDGVEDLLQFLEESDFYTAPASTKFNGSYDGGLVEHSLNVYDEMKRILTAYPEINVQNDSLAIVTLFHDLCKVNTYAKEKRNRKNHSGQWESYDAYTYSEKFSYGSHGGKSVFMVNAFMHLNPDEAVAINCHMGFSDVQNGQAVGAAFTQFPIAWLLHVADESATFIVEK